MVSNILSELIGQVQTEIKAKSIFIGAHWTFVETMYSGMASTILPQSPHGKSEVHQSGFLDQYSAKELAEWVFSDNTLEASIGLAAINSTIAIPVTGPFEINISRLLEEKGKDKNIALIGHFPFIPTLQKKARNLWVIELDPGEGEISAEKGFDYISSADIIAITSNTLINHTLAGILKASQKESFKILMGPSTPMHPLMFQLGIEVLAGVRISNPVKVIRFIQQGATFQQIRGLEKIVMTQNHVKKYSPKN